MKHYPGLMENRMPHVGKQHAENEDECWCKTPGQSTSSKKSEEMLPKGLTA